MPPQPFRPPLPEGVPAWLPAALLAMLAAILLAAALEGVVRQAVFHRRYDWRAFASSIADVVGRRLVDGLGLSIAAPVLAWAWQHRLTTIALDSVGAWALLFVGEELAYYAYHRAAHRVRWFWATHAVHHSPNELTLATALRLGWTGKLTGAPLFFAPLVWLGFSPLAVA
ncbi:MAG TPA: sterol desaturase family protein, partial [Ramlibacter sp.]|nr:sterol desaturase family protein [Ramlibacter sp.]